MNVRGLTVLNRKRNRKIAVLRYQIAGKAKCYYVYVQRSRTGILTSLKVRLKQYLSITYAYPEPMLSMMINHCLKVHIACNIERQCAETL